MKNNIPTPDLADNLIPYEKGNMHTGTAEPTDTPPQDYNPNFVIVEEESIAQSEPLASSETTISSETIIPSEVTALREIPQPVQTTQVPQAPPVTIAEPELTLHPLGTHANPEHASTAHANAKSPRAASFILALILGGLSVGAGLGGGYAVASNLITNNQRATQFATAEVMLAAQLATASEGMSMVSAVERVRPSVVSINTIRPGNLQQNSRFFSPFFEVPDEDRPSSGTGIIFYEDGEHVFILTNEHVIEQATSIEIVLGADRTVEATVKGRDISSDLAVLYVRWADLWEMGITRVITAEFGDSDSMRVGEFVMAIGNALGQGIITTQGVLSAQNIELALGQDRTLSVIQTDAAINPGNSGGPLINSRGQVIGINTVKISRPAVYGMGFAVTSNVAIPIIDAIMNETARPALGIRGNSVEYLSEEAAERLGATHGIFVSEIMPGSAAYLSELEPHDIIMFFDDQAVHSMDELRDFIYHSSLGDTVILRVLRDGQHLNVPVTFRQF